MDTHSKEYVQWMANVWRLNDERNKQIEREKKSLEDLIDRGTYYEIKDYEPIVNRDEHGNVVSVINCPYIPKFLFDGAEI